jgi:hypothetical protein
MKFVLVEDAVENVSTSFLDAFFRTYKGLNYRYEGHVSLKGATYY